MFTLNRFPQRAFRVAALTALVVSSSAFAGPVPANLGSGLDVLVREHFAQKQSARSSARVAKIDPALTQAADLVRDNAITNDQGQVKVYIHLAPRSVAARRGTFVPEAVLPATASVTAKDMSYRSGVLEAWVSLADMAALATDKRVKSIALAVKPITDVGATTSQGVFNHRTDQVAQDGTGITIGAMSDSYDTNAGASTRASVDVTSGDLPGTTNPFGNTQPVVIIDDPLTGSDEGRGMMQIIHDEAPKAKLGFATASAGQVSFADNIRSLAGLPSGTKSVAGFNADVIVDDLYYSDSPMFGTSLVGRAVNEVAAAGVTYFSSAGNRPALNGYFSDYRNVPAGTPEQLTAAIAGTNLNFSGVDPSLYAGGLHNFRTDGGKDVAQTISSGENAGGSTVMSFQWDDPYDVDPPTFNPTPFYSNSGTMDAAGTPVDFPVSFTAGNQYRIAVNATSGNFDAILTVIDPDGVAVVTNYDTTVDEELFLFIAKTGVHTIRVTRYQTTSGNFNINVHLASGTLRVTTDFNVLFFRTDTGAFVSAFSSNNIATNQPLELAQVPFNSTRPRLQLVIARSNVPTAPTPATKMRYVMTVVGGPVEYFSYDTPITFGHNHEPGCLSVAAYAPFRPYLPEDFTSPGPSYIYFDENANRLAEPIIRQKPDLAAQDGVNNTFFGSDSANDVDAFPNFFGTSAAAPSAAGIAALVLQANGGPGTVTQPQMRTILQRSGINHDLDPFRSSGTARTANGGKITITARGMFGNGNYSDTRNVSVDDLNSFAVSYVGPGSVSTLSINLQNANPNGGSELGGMPGLVWDSRARTAAAAAGFPFTVGTTVGGIAPGDISASYSQPPPAPAVAGSQWYQLDITFAANAFTGGRAFTFGADRDELRTASTTTVATGFGNSGDLLGANVALPTFTVTPGGATFSGTMSDGSTFSGIMINRIGKGYSPLDGYGFINAPDAVMQPLP